MASAKPAPFLTRLYDMVSDPTTDYAIAWNGAVSVPVAGAPAGRINAFTVIDNAALEKEVIPRFYKHSNFTSFIRQLNQYRFRKLEAKRWTFGHPCFVKGSPNILTNIRRKRKSAPPKPPERGAPAAAARRSPGSDEEIDAEAAMAQCREQTTVLERRVDQLSNSLHSALAQQAAMAQQLAAIHAYVFGGRGQGPNQARLPVPQENALAPHPSTVPVAGQPSAQREQPAAQEPASKRQMLTATPPEPNPFEPGWAATAADAQGKENHGHSRENRDNSPPLHGEALAAASEGGAGGASGAEEWMGGEPSFVAPPAPGWDDDSGFDLAGVADAAAIDQICR